MGRFQESRVGRWHIYTRYVSICGLLVTVEASCLRNENSKVQLRLIADTQRDNLEFSPDVTLCGDEEDDGKVQRAASLLGELSSVFRREYGSDVHVSSRGDVVRLALPMNGNPIDVLNRVGKLMDKLESDTKSELSGVAEPRSTDPQSRANSPESRFTNMAIAIAAALVDCFPSSTSEQRRLALKHVLDLIRSTNTSMRRSSFDRF